MAKLASPRMKGLLVVAMLMPLWSFYLVKVYAWRTMLSDGGIVNWALDPIGLDGPGYGTAAVWLVMSYLWLPFMILPIYAGLERIPNTVLSASEDLGAHPFTTFRRVMLPFALPAIVAGSIFTFSLTMGDYITPSLVSPSTQFIGNVVFSNHTNNLPLASAFAMVPIAVMLIYLLIARRRGRSSTCEGLARHHANLLRAGVGLTLAFIYVPLIVIAVYAFNGGPRWSGRRPA